MGKTLRHMPLFTKSLFDETKQVRKIKSIDKKHQSITVFDGKSDNSIYRRDNGLKKKNKRNRNDFDKFLDDYDY